MLKNTRNTLKTLLNIYDGAFAKFVNGWKPLAISMNSSIIEVYQGSECAAESTTKVEVTQLHISLPFKSKLTNNISR